jgi:hypothetical protein
MLTCNKTFLSCNHFAKLGHERALPHSSVLMHMIPSVFPFFRIGKQANFPGKVSDSVAFIRLGSRTEIQISGFHSTGSVEDIKGCMPLAALLTANSTLLACFK